MSDSSDYECGLQDGLAAERKTAMAALDAQREDRNTIRRLTEILMQCDHTLSIHGKIDGGTLLHEAIRQALAPQGRPHNDLPF